MLCEERPQPGVSGGESDVNPSSRRRQGHRTPRKPVFPALSLNSPRLLIGATAVVVLSVLLSSHLLPDRVSYQVGDRATEEIRAHRSGRYPDAEATRQLRELAVMRVPKIYRDVETAKSDVVDSIGSLFENARTVLGDKTLTSPEDRISAIQSNSRTPLSLKIARSLAEFPVPALGPVKTAAIGVASMVMSQPIQNDTDALLRAQQQVPALAARYRLPVKQAQSVAQIVRHFLKPNSIYDAERTRRAVQQASLTVETQYRPIFKGEILVHQGEEITEEHVAKFTALGLRHPRLDWTTVLSLSVLISCMIALVAFYLYHYHPAIYRNDRHLWLLVLIVIMSILGLKLAGALQIKLSAAQFGYVGVTATTLAGMLTAVLINPQLAFLVSALLSLQTGLILNNELGMTTLALISSLVAIYSVSHIRHRADSIRTALLVGCTNAAIVWILGGLKNDPLPQILTGTAWGVLSGILATAVFWFGVALLERPFGVTTHIGLLELSDTNQPLLRDLSLQAPGTFNHSIMVGNLAEAGAKAIGADALLSRVASYYHDIGKMRRPEFFIENQRNGNAHDQLNPTLSALVITSHIKEGMEMARAYRLPPLVADIICQHHGTTLVSYFYHAALARYEGNPADIEPQFRYSGPKPMSKESGIIMLADMAEAKSRCLSRPTLNQLRDLVEGVVRERIADGQLDDCDLTLKELKEIQEAFIRVLTGMLHARIDYPKANGNSYDSRNGNADPQRAAPTAESQPNPAGR
ncbi:MAG: HDIG domain-containing protein [Armatimonadetes bacterium]|nr:HDIG domain-containing protein [Armatimonadota bacterium]